MNKKKYESIINPLNKDDLIHVFLINNSVSALVSKLIIHNYSISNRNIILISLRNTDTSIFDSKLISVKNYLFDRIFMKLFKINLKGYRLRSLISRKKQKFILYTSWFYSEAEIILNSKNCIGHNYIEEGQIAHRPIKTFKIKKKKMFSGLINRNTVIAENNSDVYRDDALAFFGILKDSFPSICNKKRLIINNLNDLKKYYKPNLLGIKYIGLTCAARRIKNNKWESMLKKLIKKMPDDGGVIKFHPSFVSNTKLKNEVESIFRRIAPPSVFLCKPSIIIEMEMLYESKTLIGSLTSLNKYADHFGSKFKEVKLY